VVELNLKYSYKLKLNMLKKIGNVLGWVVVAFLFCFAVYSGWQMTKTLWPGLHDDGVMYSTLVINRASGFGNHFAVFTYALALLDGKTDFTGHGQLYYPVVAALLAKPDYEALLTFLHQSNLVGFLLAFVVFTLATRRSLKLGWLAASFLGVLGGAAVVGVLQYLQGRPEHGIPFVLLAFQLFVLTCKWPAMPSLLAGVQIGLVGAISPLPGAILGFASLLSFSFRTQETKALLVGASKMLGFSFLIWWTATSVVYEGSLVGLLLNTTQGANYFMFKLYEIPVFWLKMNLAPGLGFIFLLGVCVAGIKALKIIFDDTHRIVQKAFVILSLIPLLYLIFKHGIAWAATNYCFLPFLPGVAIWLVANIKSMAFGPFRNPVFLNRIAVIFLYLALTPPALGYFRTGLFQNSILQNGVSFQTAQAEIEEFRNRLEGNEVIMVHSYNNARSPVIFDRPPWKFRSQPHFGFLTAEKQLGFHAKYYLVLQNANDSPPEVKGFSLIHEKLAADPVLLFGMPIKNSTPGYGYAIYGRDDEWLNQLAREPKTRPLFQ
jgi:hypothetical protein